MKSLKVVAVQLPVQSHDYQYNLAHVPLASGVLAAYLKKCLPQVNITVLDGTVASCSGTERICNEILALDPDIVAISCYLWNTERSIALAGQLRRKGLKALFVAGGPDIYPDNSLISAARSSFDVFVIGEGERALCHVVSSLFEGRMNFVAEPFLKFPPVSPAEIPSPYVTGLLTPPAAGSLLLESSRGCPYRCAYCYYHHNVPRLATFPHDRVVQELNWARQSGVKEITFVDPSFTSRPDLMSFVELLASLNNDGFFSFSAELNAELCDDKLASNLARAGFRHVEVGLQSINPKALKAINRPVRINRFVKGVKALRAHGIKVMVDLIVGLPEDTEDDIVRAIDFCVTEDLFDELSLYPLSLLPGTELRKRADDQEIIYDPLPPYHVIETRWLSQESIRRIFEYAEKTIGIDYFPPEIPVTEPLPEAGVSISWSLTETDDVGIWCQTVLENPASGQALVFTLEKKDWWRYVDILTSFLKHLLEKDPFVLISWKIPAVTLLELPPDLRLEILKQFFIRRNHYKDREWFSTSSSLRSSQVFIELDDPVVPGWTLIWITPELVSGERKELWFITTCQETNFPEDLVFTFACRLLGLPENIPYRISFVEKQTV